MKQVRPLTEAEWTEPVKRIYLKYPAAFRSTNWEDIVKLANAGNEERAELLAKENEDSSPARRAENVIARRIRIQRMALFKLQADRVADLKQLFKDTAERIRKKVERLPTGAAALPRYRQIVHNEFVILRRELNKRITDHVWQGVVLGIRNMGDAIKPIIRDNQESFWAELGDVALVEEKLTMGLSRRITTKRAAAMTSTAKWSTIMDRIYQDVAKKNAQGLTLSERIWDLTTRAENDIRRTITADVVAGKPPREIADKIVKNVYVEGVDEDVETGPGIYRSPMKNALRVARTEINRAYTKATAAWAQDKKWLAGIRITLSGAHKIEDICDDHAGDLVTPEEFADLVPFHPHCMCQGTYVIKDEYLQNEEAA